MQQTIQSLVLADVPREQIELWCRQRTQHYVASSDKTGASIVARVLGKYLMAVDALDEALTPHLVLDGIWEPWVTMAIARHVKPGMRCMDVGACYGYYSLLMADIVGKDGVVQAWEPVWDGAVNLNANLNGLPVEVVHYVMGTAIGELYAISKIPKTFYNAGDVKMKRITPDVGEWCPNDKVMIVAPAAAAWDFIKIDVEGAEADVWDALGGVRDVSPKLTVCMEFTPEKHADPERFLRDIENSFTIGTCGHDGTPRPCSIEEALVPDTGGFRMLWLTR
jgi:FkbM family methyltransferase